MQELSKEKWLEYLYSISPKHFVQSPNYGEFFEGLGEKSVILGLFKDDQLLGGSLIVSCSGKSGKFAYLPYGPILNWQHSDEVQAFVDAVIDQAKSWGMDFIKISPFTKDSRETNKVLEDLGFNPSPLHILAETTWVLDVTKDPKELFQNFSKKHRNLIRRCEKEGIKVHIDNSSKALETFLKLHRETALRHKFTAFSDSYITKEFQSFLPDNANLYLATYQGEIVAGAIILNFAKCAAYRHAASKTISSSISPSYAIQWQVIQDLHSKGLEEYNFWGIAPDDAPKRHPFRGITRFKKGFGGEQIDLIHARDLPLTKKYWVNFAIQSIRKIKRGF